MMKRPHMPGSLPSITSISRFKHKWYVWHTRCATLWATKKPYVSTGSGQMVRWYVHFGKIHLYTRKKKIMF